MLWIWLLTRCAVSTPATITRRNAKAVVPTIRRSLRGKVIWHLVDREDLHRAGICAIGDVTDGTRMREHVLDDRLLRIELGRREPAPGKDALLPIALHRADRTLEHILDEELPRLRVGPQIDRADRLSGRPCGDLLEERLRQKPPIDLRHRVARMHD